MSASSPGCASAPTSSPPRRPKSRRADARQSTAGSFPNAQSLLDDPDTVWPRHTVALWYGQINRTIEFTSGLALWYRSGISPVPIRWVLVRDPDGLFEPQAFLCTNTQAEPANILGWFIMRRPVEVTVEETRAHPGVETQRQWSDLAILRTTPALFGLFSIVCLWAHDINEASPG